MKKIFNIILFTLLSISVIAQTELQKKLEMLPGVISVKEMQVEPYSEYYEIYFKQVVDYKDASKGTFNQRVLLGHTDYQNHMIVELQGYNIWTSKQGELSKLFNGNQLSIEHRFFKDSKPKGKMPWKCLTVANAAHDQHIIIQAIKKIYDKDKWITTGISKGGQTTIMHRYFYPNDVDVSVPYVAPHNLARVDSRIQNFLNTVGSRKDRKSILEFQKLCFKNLNKMMPLMDDYTDKRHFSFKYVGGSHRALQMTILEYPFAYWQWGAVKTKDIPHVSEDIKILFDHLVKYGDPSFFEDENIDFQRPYFWAAMTEMGIYDYDITPFKKYLTDKDNITFRHTMPKGLEDTPFDGSTMKKVYDWLQTDAENMLFIYGAMDTWGSTAVELGGNNKCKKFLMPTGHHGTRIRDFSENDKMDIMNCLNQMMN
ncbi:MAG: S28 family serine protease [Marinifilaceae bacterium]